MLSRGPGRSSRTPDVQSWQTMTASTAAACSASRCSASDWEPAAGAADLITQSPDLEATYRA